jgi:hypothetical protein
MLHSLDDHENAYLWLLTSQRRPTGLFQVVPARIVEVRQPLLLRPGDHLHSAEIATVAQRQLMPVLFHTLVVLTPVVLGAFLSETSSSTATTQIL